MPINLNVKKFLIHLAVEQVLVIVRGWLNDSIKQFTPSDLYEAILENRDLWTNLPSDMLDQARKFKKTFKNVFDQNIDRLDAELVLNWIKEDHPDLYSTILNSPRINGPESPPIGVIWISGQVNKIKDKIKLL